jgi:hypothetical protein
MPEIANCPQCQRQLRVPDNLLGQSVQCPSCRTTFVATAAGGSAPPAAPPQPAPPPWPGAGDQVSDQPRPQGAPPGRGPEQVYWEPPQREYGFQDIPQRHLRPHNGTMILVLGILSLVVCGLLGPVAWIMGNSDLAAMRSGSMDRSGEGITQAGRICGMIASILMIVVCSIYGVIFLIAIAGSAAGGRNF